MWSELTLKPFSRSGSSPPTEGKRHVGRPRRHVSKSLREADGRSVWYLEQHIAYDGHCACPMRQYLGLAARSEPHQDHYQVIMALASPLGKVRGYGVSVAHDMSGLGLSTSSCHFLR
jgi:hypothetical protein